MLGIAVLVLVIYLVGTLSGVDPTWLHIAAGAVVLLSVVVLFFKKQSAQKAAGALEAALKSQGQSQAASTRPDQRAGIEELKTTFDESLDLLRKSKMGRGALHSIPWYMLIGPPGSGKSTLLRQSGLSFPYMTKGRSAIRGLGGTKNCDWWFADRGILLDTAGRYTSETEDRDEWMAFLRLLKRGRGKRPVNGVVVAMGLAELVESTDAELNLHAENIRDRIDELTRELQTVFPIYVVFTKCDRLRGFVETFDTLNKDQRKQVWGFTFPFARPREFSVPEQFGKEFDDLYRSLVNRRIDLLASDHFKKRKAQVYAFPLQVLRLKERLQTFLGQLQQPNPYQEVSPVRGIYFTSGTQEGTTIDRILKVLRPAELELDVPEESRRCYFVDDLFNRVVFEDATLAAPTAQAKKKDKLLRNGGLAVLGAAALATIVLGAQAWWGFRGTCQTIEANVGATANRSPEAMRAALDAQRTMLDSKSRAHHLDNGGVRENLQAWYDRALVEYATLKLDKYADDEASRIGKALPPATERDKERVYAEYAEGGRRLAAIESGLLGLESRSETERAAALALWDAAVDDTPLRRRHFECWLELPKQPLAITARNGAMRSTSEKLQSLLNSEEANDLAAARALPFEKLFPQAWKGLKEVDTLLGSCTAFTAQNWHTDALSVAAKGPLFAKYSTKPGSPTIEQFFVTLARDVEQAKARAGDTSKRPLRDMTNSGWDGYVAKAHVDFLALVDTDFDINWQTLLQRLEALAKAGGEAKDEDKVGGARVEVIPALVTAYRLGRTVLDKRGAMPEDEQQKFAAPTLEATKQLQGHTVPPWAKEPGTPRADSQPPLAVERSKQANNYLASETKRIVAINWGVPALNERFQALETALIASVCTREWRACRAEIEAFARAKPFKSWNAMLAKFPFAASANEDASATQLAEAVRDMSALDRAIRELAPASAFGLDPAFVEDLAAVQHLCLILYGDAVAKDQPAIETTLSIEMQGSIAEVKIEGEARSITSGKQDAWTLGVAESLAFTVKLTTGETWSYPELLDPRGNNVPLNWQFNRRLVPGPWGLKRLFSIGTVAAQPDKERVSTLRFRGRPDDLVLLIAKTQRDAAGVVFDADWPGERYALSNVIWKQP